jgi:hypothetical protein
MPVTSAPFSGRRSPNLLRGVTLASPIIDVGNVLGVEVIEPV